MVRTIIRAKTLKSAKNKAKSLSGTIKVSSGKYIGKVSYATGGGMASINKGLNRYSFSKKR